MVIVLTLFQEVFAQKSLQTYIDIGENNVSEGIFIKNTYRFSYQYYKYNIESGLQLELLSNKQKTLTGFDVTGSRQMLIKEFPFEVKSFFILNRFSDLLHETNWGFRIATKRFAHFLLEFGTNSRTYIVKKIATGENVSGGFRKKMKENISFTYNLTAYLKPYDNIWNISLSCTNVDYYTINQSTNPIFNLQAKYNASSNLILNMGAWYKQAGIFNINANYFGYFFRGGITWKI